MVLRSLDAGHAVHWGPVFTDEDQTTGTISNMHIAYEVVKSKHPIRGTAGEISQKGRSKRGQRK